MTSAMLSGMMKAFCRITRAADKWLSNLSRPPYNSKVDMFHVEHYAKPTSGRDWQTAARSPTAYLASDSLGGPPCPPTVRV